jgi:colanic acid biosynthesis glycosyl transferase WcaI
MKGRVFIVSELYYPEETSTGYLLTKTAEGIAQTMPVSVICSQPTYSARGRIAPNRETRNGVTIERCGGTTFDKDGLVGRIFNAFSISLLITWRAFWRFRRGDAVLVVTNPPFLPFGIALASALRQARCALLIHDVYPEVLTAAGMGSPRSLLARILTVATRWLYARVDRIVVLGRDMGELAARKLSRHTDKIVLVPNWAAREVQPSPKASSAMLNRLGLADRFVIQYAGNMGRTHGLETLVETARRLADRPVHWLFIGSGAKKAWLVEQAATTSNLTVLDPLPRSDRNVFLNACDIAIISFVPGMAGVSVPSRMYDIMAAGKPIIAVADRDSELARVVIEEQIGWVVAPKDADGLFALVERIHALPELVAEYGARARTAALSKYQLEHAIEKYTALMHELLVS